MAKKNKKIVKYRRPLQINIGMIIFFVIFLYLAFYVYQYCTRDKVQPYEVTEGSIASDRNFTGIVLRDETTEYADQSGYINYYIREGKRAAAGTSIYSMDETGEAAKLMEENAAAEQLSEEDVISVKKALSAFSLSYSDMDFSQVYDSRYSLDAMVMEYANFNAANADEQLAEQLGGNFSQIHTPVSGVISYSIDGFEDLDASQISESSFDRSQYSRAITHAGDLVEQGTPIYKVITDDNWSLVFPLSETDVTDFRDLTSLTVRFPGHDLTTSGSFSMISGADGNPYGKLDFNRYMVQFISERYLDFQVIMEVAQGLKIPVSSVTSKNFYLVPVTYLTTGGDTDQEGFNKEIYTESGTLVEFVPATIYYSTDEFYYIDTAEDAEIHAGDYLVKPNSSDRFQVGQTASLQGVYNINRGYSVFKQIEILAQNNEFYTVKKGTSYGLSVYDHIVLDASTVAGEDQLIYQ